MSSIFYLKAAGILGASGVALGAFGAHGLAKHVGNDATKIHNWATAAHYQIMHSVALAAITAIPPSVRRIHPIVAPLLLGGTIAFSGTIYLLTLKRDTFRPLGPVTPLGGMALIAGWAALLL
ncbi:hypothetical protein BX666DRAFT_2022180 [Dichotomocladium elegans]|nr:hypothetical protein BX666DRAFT_2022180 [Dichotomocladium elegans]